MVDITLACTPPRRLEDLGDSRNWWNNAPGVMKAEIRMQLKTIGRGAFRVFLAVSVVVAACSTIPESRDFERHRSSALTVPYDKPDVMYFDVRLTADVPDNDPAGEARRMEWLEGWLEARNLCAAGYEILERRKFRYEEDNPGRYDLRYELRCKSVPVEPAG